MKKKYIPHPIDTSDVKLSKDLEELLELVAKNVHEVWSFNRMNEGWVYGEERNTEKKTTPCLVEYDELPEVEKDYDRNTALETIKTILKLGYRISKDKKDVFIFRNGRVLYKVVGDLFDYKNGHIYVLKANGEVKKEITNLDQKYLLFQVARAAQYEEIFPHS